MRFLAVNLALEERPVLVVGGGAVALRKCFSAVGAGGRVTVLSPQLSSPLAAMVTADALVHWPRAFRSGDTAGFFLVFAATDDPEVNRAIASEAIAAGILVDVVDAPDLGTITSPAVLARGELVIAVSTGGASPVLARRIRDEIAGVYGPEYALVLEILAAVRQKLLTDSPDRAYNKRIFEQLADSDLPELCRQESAAAVDQVLSTLIGSGYTLSELGISAKELS